LISPEQGKGPQMSDAFDNLIERQSPPSTKAATDYLATSGATAISIIQTDGVCAFHITLKIDQEAISTHWLPEAVATPVIKSARHHAGKTTDIDAAIAALHQAATDHRATLMHTPSCWNARAARSKGSTLDARDRRAGAVQQGIQTAAHRGHRKRFRLHDQQGCLGAVADRPDLAARRRAATFGW
jgi:hypothetical protein